MEKTENIKIHGWEIEPDGTMVHERTRYYILGESLCEGNWIVHMLQKTWVDPRGFIEAFFEACRVRGLDRVTLDPKITF